jgi:hypothetical protein
MSYIGNSPANVGNYQIIDNIASSFNGSTTSFALASGGIAITPAKSGQLIISVNGVVQQPDDTGTNGFKLSSSNIVFSAAPANGDTFWGIYQGQEVDIGVPSDDSVDVAHIKSNAVTLAKIASQAVDEDNLYISNAGTNGQFLSKQSGNNGGLTWADVDALPSQSGNNGKYLTTNGSAASWAVLDTDANTTTKGLYEHAHTIAANYSITSGNNAMTAGPITINSSVSVTIPSGSTWVIA